MSAKEIAVEVMQSPKAAAIVSTATATTGMGTILEWIPAEIGKVGVLFGVILSFVMIVYWIACTRIKLAELRIIQEKERRMNPRD